MEPAPPGTAYPCSGLGTLMTCSDKIARWSLLGVQGTLLSSLLAAGGPLYLSSITVGRKFSQVHCERALCCRLQGYDAVLCRRRPPRLRSSGGSGGSGGGQTSKSAAATGTSARTARTGAEGNNKVREVGGRADGDNGGGNDAGECGGDNLLSSNGGGNDAGECGGDNLLSSNGGGNDAGECGGDNLLSSNGGGNDAGECGGDHLLSSSSLYSLHHPVMLGTRVKLDEGAIVTGTETTPSIAPDAAGVAEVFQSSPIPDSVLKMPAPAAAPAATATAAAATAAATVGAATVGAQFEESRCICAYSTSRQAIAVATARLAAAKTVQHTKEKASSCPTSTSTSTSTSSHSPRRRQAVHRYALEVIDGRRGELVEVVEVVHNCVGRVGDGLQKQEEVSSARKARIVPGGAGGAGGEGSSGRYSGEKAEEEEEVCGPHKRKSADIDPAAKINGAVTVASTGAGDNICGEKGADGSSGEGAILSSGGVSGYWEQRSTKTGSAEALYSNTTVSSVSSYSLKRCYEALQAKLLASYPTGSSGGGGSGSSSGADVAEIRGYYELKESALMAPHNAVKWVLKSDANLFAEWVEKLKPRLSQRIPGI
jgi:hypothetical protein